MTAPPKLPKERTHFKELLLANHFGTIQASDLEPVVEAAGNTTYEELTCVGYEPTAKRLAATVNLKQNGGYSGGICTAGSQEYVKFFTSTDGGATWHQQGTVSFTVWDVAGPKPLEYAASLNADLSEACCKTENLVLVRAILSWAVQPGGPDDPVVWGNSLDATIQVAPLKSGTLIDLFECLDLNLQEEVSQLVNPLQEVTFGTTKELTPLDLHEAYRGTKVQPHRYLHGHIQKLLASPGTLTAKLANPGFVLFPGVQDIDISKLIQYYMDPQGNESYEQIGCLGLNPQAAELVATIDLKLSSGYSGGLCTNGSQELVAFWVDWEDGSGWEYVGTTSVTVHDFQSIPADGLKYSAFLPFHDLLYTHRKPCQDGPTTARVRAVLSWQTPPSTTDPYAVPVWGGHDETTILIPPGDPISSGGEPVLETIGGMDISNIDALGLAHGQAAALGFTADASPFGGQVWFTGHIFNRQAGAGGPGIYYRIWISVDGGAFVPMNTSFNVTTHHYPSGTATHVLQSPQTLAGFGDGWYPCLEDWANLITVDQNTLGYWPSYDGKAQIYIEAVDSVGPLGSPTQAKLIKLDNTAPVSAVAITSGGGSCGDFKIGDVMEGTYSGSDDQALGGISFSLEPPASGPFTFTNTPTNHTYVSEDGTWTLVTKPAGTEGLKPCGYVLRLDVSDKTIVNSAAVGRDTAAFTGFCLKK